MIVGITVPVGLIVLSPFICCGVLTLTGLCIVISACLCLADECLILGLSGFGVYKFKTRNDRPKKINKKPNRSAEPIQ